MFRRTLILAVIAAACVCTSHAAHAQFGGIQLQIGGYGPGVYSSYGTGYYSGYGNAYYDNSYYGNQLYGGPYYNVYNGGYNTTGQPSTGLYPSFGSSYVAPYYYPIRPYAYRRFRR